MRRIGKLLTAGLLLLSPRTASSAERYLIGIANATGYGGVKYESRLELGTSSGEPRLAKVELFLRKDHVKLEYPLRVEPEASRTVDATEWFSEDAGVLHVVAEADVLPTLRTFRMNDCGEVGLAERGVDSRAFIEAGDVGRVGGLFDSEEGWVNLGFMNPWEQEDSGDAIVTVELWTPGGTRLSFDVTVPGERTVQVARPLRGLRIPRSAALTATIRPKHGTVLAWASIVDAASGDFETRVAQPRHGFLEGRWKLEWMGRSGEERTVFPAGYELTFAGGSAELSTCSGSGSYGAFVNGASASLFLASESIQPGCGPIDDEALYTLFERDNYHDLQGSRLTFAFDDSILGPKMYLELSRLPDDDHRWTGIAIAEGGFSGASSPVEVELTGHWAGGKFSGVWTTSESAPVTVVGESNSGPELVLPDQVIRLRQLNESQLEGETVRIDCCDHVGYREIHLLKVN